MWNDILKDEIEKDYFKNLANYIKERRKIANVFPPPSKLVRAFELTPVDTMKVVIIGQDPYHGEGQANGLAFAVDKTNPNPPSLVNILKEVEDDVGNFNGDLENWAKSGVFLLNTILTVEEGSPGCHANRGWEQFTAHVIREISKRKESLVFLLWGKFAQSRKIYIEGNRHLILEAPHPSPLSAHRGFFGCRHFSKTNEFLKERNLEIINW